MQYVNRQVSLSANEEWYLKLLDYLIYLKYFVIDPAIGR